MKKTVTIGIFDNDKNLYSDDTSLKYPHKFIKISDLKGIFIMTDYKNITEIEKRVNDTGSLPIYFLGSGNYHYLTLPLIMNLDENLTLIVFDHHLDYKKLSFNDYTSCGSWIFDVIYLCKNVKKIIVIGPYKNIIDYPSDKLLLLQEKDINYKNILKLNKSIPTKNIYISIDRDILNEKTLITNWNQGNLTIDKIVKSIKLISKNKNLIRADISGDLDWSFHSKIDISNKCSLKKSIHVNNILFKHLINILQK